MSCPCDGPGLPDDPDKKEAETKEDKTDNDNNGKAEKGSDQSLAEEDCCSTVCQENSPDGSPSPPPGPPPAEANVCEMQQDGTCKSLLNIRCADWRDKAHTWASYKQKDYIEKCMAQDCVQSMELSLIHI